MQDSTRFDKTIALIKKYDPDETQNLTYSPKIREAAMKDAGAQEAGSWAACALYAGGHVDARWACVVVFG